MKILGLETSCDEAAASLLEVAKDKLQIKSNLVWSQTEIHRQYGGVVPEVAARQHVESIVPVIEEALNGQKPDLIAVTYGPGLITSLQVGLQSAKTLSYAWQIPLVGVNHLEAHLFSWLLTAGSLKVGKELLPAVGLIVSGGHTELVLVKGFGWYKLIGQTRDDAAGEAFDKVAKLLGLGYPGGPIISHFAKKGDAGRIDFPRPMMESKDFDFSFSGLKTAVKYHLGQLTKTGGLSQAYTNDICASFQAAVIDVLVGKTVKAARKFKAKSVWLGGGVSANESLVKKLSLALKPLTLHYPAGQFTGDNAAMIALVGHLGKKKASKVSWRKLTAEAGLGLV